MPWLGLLGSLRLCVALNFVVAAAAFSASARRPPGKRDRPKRINVSATVGVAISVLLIIVVVLGDPPWDPEVMSSAVYRYAPSLTDKTRQELFQPGAAGETIFYKALPLPWPYKSKAEDGS